MAKKQFNFAQMAESPVAQDANKTMVDAFEPKDQVDTETGEVKTSEGTQETRNSGTEETSNPVTHTHETHLAPTEQKQVPVTNVLTGKDALRNEFMQFMSTADFTYKIGINVDVPPTVDEKLNAIKEELRRTSNANLKLTKKNLVQLFVYEGVEKWYTSVTGRKV